jgi:hypothetical protein
VTKKLGALTAKILAITPRRYHFPVNQFWCKTAFLFSKRKINISSDDNPSHAINHWACLNDIGIRPNVSAVDGKYIMINKIRITRNTPAKMAVHT